MVVVLAVVTGRAGTIGCCILASDGRRTKLDKAPKSAAEFSNSMTAMTAEIGEQLLFNISIGSKHLCFWCSSR